MKNRDYNTHKNRVRQLPGREFTISTAVRALKTCMLFLSSNTQPYFILFPIAQLQGFLLVGRPSPRGCFPSTSSSPSWIPSWCSLSPGTIHIFPLHKKLSLENRQVLSLDKEAHMDVSLELAHCICSDNR